MWADARTYAFNRFILPKNRKEIKSKLSGFYCICGCLSYMYKVIKATSINIYTPRAPTLPNFKPHKTVLEIENISEDIGLHPLFCSAAVGGVCVFKVHNMGYIYRNEWSMMLSRSEIHKNAFSLSFLDSNPEKDLQFMIFVHHW